LLVVVVAVVVVANIVLVDPIKEPLEMLELPTVVMDKAKAAVTALVVVVVVVVH
jgi:hypothetical protein